MQVVEWSAPDPATIEAAVKATCVRLGLTARETADIVRAHRRTGRRTIVAGMSATFRALGGLLAREGLPWDDARRRRAEEIAYVNHVGGLLLRRERAEGSGSPPFSAN